MRLFLSPLAPIALLITLQLTTVVGAAGAVKCRYTPAVGSLEHKAIMDTVRGPVEKELDQHIKFLVKKFTACRNWAFLEAVPQKPNGQPVDWTISSYAGAVAEDMCGFHVHALLNKKAGRWRVRYYEICATDVPYVIWPKEYGAPPELFPVTE